MKELKRPTPTTTILTHASDGSIIAHDVYRGAALAKRAKAYAERYGLEHEYNPRANHCNGIWARHDCTITRVGTLVDVAIERQRRLDQIAYRRRFSPRQRKWLKTGKATCVGVAVYPFRERVVRDPDEAAHLMSLTDDDHTGWLSYADRLDEYGDAGKLPANIRWWVQTGKQEHDEAHDEALDLMNLVGMASRYATPEWLRAEGLRVVAIKRKGAIVLLTCPVDWTEAQIKLGTNYFHGYSVELHPRLTERATGIVSHGLPCWELLAQDVR